MGASNATIYHFDHLNKQFGDYMSLLAQGGYKLHALSDMQSLLHQLQNDPDILPDAVLLDGGYLRDNAAIILEYAKRNDKFRSLPLIIFQDSEIPEELSKLVAACSCFFLHPPYTETMLQSVLVAAISDYRRWQKLRKDIETRTSAIGLIQSGVFHLKNHDEARNLTTMLSLACPEPDRVALGLLELIANGIEHGNLGINFEEKTQLLQSGQWNEEIARRLESDAYKDRYVEVVFAREQNMVRFKITDMGAGFKPKDYMKINPDRMHLPHGRGIAMAKTASFDRVTYLGKGNSVEAIAFDPHGEGYDL